MKILYIHQYFNTPDQPGGTRSYWIAKQFIKDGLEVTVITSDPNPSIKEIRKISIDGINVIYIPNSYDNAMSFFQRLRSFLNFMFLASRYALKQKDIDFVYATSTPLTVGVPALIKKWFQKTPFIFEVRDLWPEVPIQMGALQNSILRNSALYLEKIIYKNSNFVIALSPGMEDGVLRFPFMKGRTAMVPNMSKVDKFFPRLASETIYDRFKIKKNNFNVVHFGAMGIANGLEYIADAALITKQRGNSKIHYHFLGGGADEKKLKNFKIKHNLDNLHFHGKHKMKVVSEFVNCCDVSIVTFKNLSILATNSPNKLFDSLSAGLPIIVNSNGWTKDLVEDNNCGVFVDPEYPESLYVELEKFSTDSERLTIMSRNSRNLALNKFDKSILAKQVSSIVFARISKLKK